MELRKLVLLVLTCALMLGAAPARPSTAMMRPINAAIAAVDHSSAAGLTGMYASNATIVDEFSPYSWRGAQAARGWISSFVDFSRATRLTSPHGDMQPIQTFDTSAGKAYIAVPVRFTGRLNGKPFVETGILAFTLSRSGANWIIDTQSWATISMKV